MSHGVDAQAIGAYEFEPHAQFINNKTICIAISQSGETADTIIAAKLAKKNGAHLVGIINARGTTLERLADTVMLVGSGPEIAVISTKAFTAQLSTLYQLAMACSDKYEEAQHNIQHLGETLNTWLNDKTKNEILELAKQLVEKEHIYIIGKHINHAAAMECALKIKETSYIHAESFAAGELKHGVIALIEQGTPCIVIGSNDNLTGEIRSSAAELKARGATIIGIAPFEATEFDQHIKTPDLGDLTVFPNIVVGQLLGYFAAIGRGADPDKPRNLAKSVTVK
jgi:glucosamine--fructose-6-phosphate aminotransferase (isomerizing)